MWPSAAISLMKTEVAGSVWVTLLQHVGRISYCTHAIEQTQARDHSHGDRGGANVRDGIGV